MFSRLPSAFSAVLLLLLSGCAAMPVAFLPAAIPAITAAAGGGISYTFTNIAYRTMTRPAHEVEEAAMKALGKMSIEVGEKRRAGDELWIKAETKKLAIYITVESMTPTLTKMTVNAKKGLVFKDKTTAFEIIFQTELALSVPAYGNGPGRPGPGAPEGHAG